MARRNGRPSRPAGNLRGRGITPIGQERRDRRHIASDNAERLLADHGRGVARGSVTCRAGQSCRQQASRLSPTRWQRCVTDLLADHMATTRTWPLRGHGHYADLGDTLPSVDGNQRDGEALSGRVGAPYAVTVRASLINASMGSRMDGVHAITFDALSV